MQKRISGVLLPVLMSFLLFSCGGYRTTFVPRMSITQEYTDNLDLSPDNPRSELLTVTSPGFTFAASNPRRDLSVSCDPAWTYYALTGTDVATRYAGAVNAVERFSRYSTLEFTEGLVRTDDPVVREDISFSRTDEPGLRDDTLRRGRTPYWTNATSLTFRHAFGPEDFFALRYVNGMLRNEDPTEEDSTRHEPSFALTYWFNQNYGFDTSFQYTRGDFSLDTTPFNEMFGRVRLLRRLDRNWNLFVQYAQTFMDNVQEEPDHQVHDATMGVDYHLSRTTFLTFSGGYFIEKLSGGDQHAGYVVRSDMAKEFSRGALRVSGGTGYRETFFGAENLGFTEFYEATFAGRYDFSRRLVGEVSSTYSHNIYTDEAGRVDDIITFGAGIAYRVRPWLSASVRYAHRRVDSTLETDSYQENRFTLGLTFVPSRPILFEQ